MSCGAGIIPGLSQRKGRQCELQCARVWVGETNAEGSRDTGVGLRFNNIKPASQILVGILPELFDLICRLSWHLSGCHPIERDSHETPEFSTRKTCMRKGQRERI